MAWTTVSIGTQSYATVAFSTTSAFRTSVVTLVYPWEQLSYDTALNDTQAGLRLRFHEDYPVFFSETRPLIFRESALSGGVV